MEDLTKKNIKAIDDLLETKQTEIMQV